MSCLGGGVRQGNRSAGAQAGWYGAWVLLKPHHKMVQVPALVYRHAVGGSNSKGLGCFMHSTVAARGFCSSDWLLASPDSHHRKAHRTAGGGGGGCAYSYVAQSFANTVRTPRATLGCLTEWTWLRPEACSSNWHQCRTIPAKLCEAQQQVARAEHLHP
jgi:hypothetical protein